MSTTIQGLKYSDQLAALIQHALDHGFRLVPDPKAKPNGAVLFPPDKNQSQIRFSEVRSRFNRAHYENVRREIYRAGCPPLPEDVKNGVVVEGESIEALVASGQIPADHSVTDLREVFASLADPTLANGLVDMIADPEVAPSFIGILVEGLAGRTLGEPHAAFLGTLVANTHRHLYSHSEAVVQKASAAVEASMRKDVDDALAMAADAERRAEREEAAAARLAKSEGKAREDCAKALRRAEAAEAEAARLNAALAPLRGLLATTEA